MEWRVCIAQVRYVRGGVARNVAESMSLLGTAPFLISVVGEDVAGTFFKLLDLEMVYVGAPISCLVFSNNATSLSLWGVFVIYHGVGIVA